jgi:hypothetical protein
VGPTSTERSHEREERTYSNREINRELTTLKRILNWKRRNGKLIHVPHVSMLKERNVRTSLFEREPIERILGHLPTPIRPAVQPLHHRVGGSDAVLPLQCDVSISRRAPSAWTAHDDERRGAERSRSPNVSYGLSNQSTMVLINLLV